MTPDAVGERTVDEALERVGPGSVRESTRRLLDRGTLSPRQVRSLLGLPAADDRPVRDVAAAGADPTGDRSIDGVLASLAEPNVVLRFPPGRYRVDRFESDHDGLELRGEDATLVPPDRREAATWLRFGGVGVALDGFELDVRDCSFPPAVRVAAPRFRVERVAVRGSMGLDRVPDDGERGGRGYSLLFCPTDPDGAGLVRRLYLPDGAADPDGNGNRFGLVSNHETFRGDLVYDGLWMEEWPNNTVYHHDVGGKLFVRNGYFRNTNGAVRCGGETEVVNCTFVKDGPVPGQRWWRPEDPMGRMRCVWTSGGDTERGSEGTVRVEDCDVRYRGDDGTRPDQAGTPLRIDPATPETVVRDLRMAVESTELPAVAFGGRRTDLTLTGLELRHAGERPAIAGADGVVPRAVSGTVETAGPPADDPDLAARLEAGTPVAPDVDPPLPTPPEPGTTPR